MKNSLKQLFRQPAKALLFLFLMAAATMLLVFGAAMYKQNVLRTQALDGMFTTIGAVEQPKLSADASPSPGETIPLEVMDFPGANYTVPPENRPFYLAYLPELKHLPSYWSTNPTGESTTYDLLEFRVLENVPGSGLVQAEITQVLFNGNARMDHFIWGSEYNEEINVKVGRKISLRQDEDTTLLEPGKTYVGYLYDGYGGMMTMPNLEEAEVGVPVVVSETRGFYPMQIPFTSQVDAHGAPVDNGHFPQSTGIDQVTEGFYGESGRYQDWENMIEAIQMADQVVPVLPVSNWDLITCFRNSSLRVRGRMITQEELDQGAKVCLVSQEFAEQNLLYEGDKITLPLIASMYGYQDVNPHAFTLPDQCSLLDANGQPYEPFWEAEYEIVGIYTLQYKNQELPFSDMFIIPQKSVEASDQENILYYGPMNRSAVSFQIPNGTIGQFTAAFEASVPEDQRPNIFFDDMGYSRAVDSLNDAKQTAFLLFLVGLLSAAAIIALLLYFFVVLEKKRTAVERSLGMTKRQCQASLISGILVLTLAASLAGSAAAGVVLDRVNAAAQAELLEQNTIEPDEDGFVKDWGLGGIYNFSAQYSPWAMWDIKGNQAALGEVAQPLDVYIAAPLVLCAFVGLLAALLIGRSLKLEPLLLLNGNGA